MQAKNGAKNGTTSGVTSGVKNGVKNGPCPRDDPRAPALRPDEVRAIIETLYPRIWRLAWRQLARISGRNPAQLSESPTVHADDLCMDLLAQREPYRNAEHLMAVATIKMFRLITDYLRRRSRQKRGGGHRGEPLTDQTPDPRGVPADWLLDDGVDAMLTRFSEEHPRHAQVLVLHVFMERSIPDIATCLGVSTATVERDLRAARLYFRAALAFDDRATPTTSKPNGATGEDQR